MTVLSSISASLRGEAPMVRVKIVPVGPGDAAVGGAASTGVSAPTPSLISTLGSRAKAALMNQQQPPLPQQQQQSAGQGQAEEVSDGGQSKTMALLSRLGLCRKPAAEDDGEEQGPGPAAAGAAGGGASGGGGGPAQVTIPITSSGVSAARLPPPRRAGGLAGGEPRLVRLVLSVATQGVNLDIKSPHRKSRRTPSHEAIEAMAGELRAGATDRPDL